MAKTVYDIIKKQNGEGFARVLRDKNLLDIPDIVQQVKYAGHSAADAEQLFPYLWSLKEFTEENAPTDADPFELLNQAGYHAFEVHNLDEQNSIKRFFRDHEQLCTFTNTDRYQKNYMIHAVRHEVWRDPYAISPSPTPGRQDEYGTSVISIQIAKSGGFISIKNRYNHTVQNPDNTFHSNPDEIIPGLSAALKGYFHVNWNSTAYIPDGFTLLNGNILKVNFEVNNRYVGDGFYTSGDIVDIDKNNQVQIDYFIWDNRTKQLQNPTGCWDDFPRVFNEFIQDKTVTITGKSPNQAILVDGKKCIQLQNHQIVSLDMPGVKILNGYFLYSNTALTELNMPDLTDTGMSFLARNEKLSKINIPNLESVGDYFLANNTVLTELDFPNLISVGSGFVNRNQIINRVNLPKLQYIKFDFLSQNLALTELDLPMAKEIANNFLENNQVLRRLNLGNMVELPCYFLRHNVSLQQLDAPNLIKINSEVLCDNRDLLYLNTPKLQFIDYRFLENNTALRELNLPNLRIVGDRLLASNTAMREIDLPILTRVGNSFLYANQDIHRISAPRLQSVGYSFMNSNTALTEIDFPELVNVGTNFLGYNTQIQRAQLPKLEHIDSSFMMSNKKLKYLSLPNITNLPSGFMWVNRDIKLHLPKLQKIILGYNESQESTPVIDTPITDLFPERRTKAQRFRAAIKNFYANMQIKYQVHDNRDM
ncbi:MAG: leucine-rich repeat domain-containing protein [Lachnospiraceae bacterium]|nr:leucine-rich repeat domain-containing protein [Lachnospiraceae bacterium]